MNINRLLNSYFKLTNTIPKNFEDLNFSCLKQNKLPLDLRNLIVEKYGDEKAFKRYKVNRTKVLLWKFCTREELDSMLDVHILDCGENSIVKICPESVEELICSGKYCALEKIESSTLKKLDCSDNRHIEVCPEGVEKLICTG